MTDNDNDIITGILKAEGQYVDHPADRGGPTNRGITRKTLEAWRKGPVTIDDLRNLTEAEARAIYRQEYIEAPGFAAISNDKLRAAVVDAGVNHGVRRAAQWLQEALHVTPDGVLGLGTMTALGKADWRSVLIRFLGHRARFYGKLITNQPNQAVFAHGWMNRLAEQLELAI